MELSRKVVAPGVDLCLVERDGFPVVAIEVRDQATTTGVRKAIPEALLARSRLHETPGQWTISARVHLLEHLCLDNARGVSYAALAERLNRKIEEALNAMARHHTSAHAHLTARSRVSGLLRSLGYNEEQANRCIQDGRVSVSRGEAPDLIDREKVISVLRAWRESPRHGIAHAYYEEERAFKEWMQAKATDASPEDSARGAARPSRKPRSAPVRQAR